jgi:periplasmic protein TonB
MMRSRYVGLLLALCLGGATNAQVGGTDPSSSAPEITYDLSSTEEQPEFPGGLEARMKFLQEHMRYPKEALEKGVQGKVYLQLDIDKAGRVTNVIVKRGVDASLDAEAVRVVSLMPAWTPGKIGGKPVIVRIIQPIIFSLSDH